jgi:hypothetical protein
VECLEERYVLSPVVVTFDDLAGGTYVSGQYHDTGGPGQGVDFLQPMPVVRQVDPGQAQSGDQVADLSQPGAELFVPTVDGRFPNAVKHVQVYVGAFSDGVATQVQLTAFDKNHQPVAQTGLVTVNPGAGFHTLLAVDSPAGDINYFEVSAPQGLGDHLGIDSLSFEHPAALPGPDFNLTAAGGFSVAPGASTTITITVNRFNGSTGAVQLSAAGLPQGVTATFTPDPAADTSTLTLTAAPDAPLTGSGALVTVTGTPLDPSAGPGPQTVQFGVAVSPNFFVSVVGPSQVDVPACSTATVPVQVSREVNFTDTIDLSVTGLPAGVQASFQPSSLGLPSDGSNVNQSTLSLTGAAGQPLPDHFDVTIWAKDGLQASQTVLHVHAIPVTISAVTLPDGQVPAFLETPRSLHRGTEVVLHGTGLSSDCEVQFGNPYALASPRSVSADGTALDVTVPRLATDGPVTLITPNGCSIASPAQFAVHSYRNTNGFAFANPTIPGVSFDDVTQLFGYDQTHFSFPNPFLPFILPDIVTPIPDPLAGLFTAIADQALNDGQCSGMSLASQRLIHGNEPFSAFPLQAGATDATVWNLAAPDAAGGPPDTLKHYIHVQHIAQLSAEALHHYLTESLANLLLGSGHVYADVAQALATGDFPRISMRDGTSGHEVVAYNLEQDPSQPGAFYIDVYDNNVPFTTAENLDAKTHRDAEDGSRIHVDPNGHWEFPNLPEDQSQPRWNGTLDTLAVTPYSVVPVQPTIPTSLAGLTILILGDSAQTAQVSDAAGHTLLAPDGTTNTDTATRLPDATVFAPEHGSDPAPPLYLLGGDGPYRQTVRTATGSYTDTLLSHDFGVRVDDLQASPGASDTLTLDAAAKGFHFQAGGTSESLTAQLIARAADHTEHTATIHTTSFGGAGDGFAFDPSGQTLTYTHEGPATDFSVTLSGFDQDGSPITFTSPLLHLGSGDRATFSPADWHYLNTITLTVTHPDGSQSQDVLQGPPLGVAGVNAGTSTGLTFRGVVASFTDPRGARLPGRYAATISWGDGQASTGAITSDGRGGFQVAGAHAYAAPGVYAVTVLVQDQGGDAATASSTVAVNDDVSGLVQIIRGRLRPRGRGRYRQTLTLRNTSNSWLEAPLALVLNDLTRRVRLVGQTGITHSHVPPGHPYLDIPVALAPGGSLTVVLNFGNAPHGANYVPTVLAGPGQR